MFRYVIPPSMPPISAASAWLNPPSKVTRHLAEGAHDFGGHRVKAMQFVKQAEAELQEALAYDWAHDPIKPTPAAAPTK